MAGQLHNLALFQLNDLRIMITVALENVCKTYGTRRDPTRAVDDVSWDARGGEVFGVLGPNGAGKTTMIRMLLDILRPDTGVVRVNNDADGNRQPSFRWSVGYLPEERGLYKKRKAIEVLVYLGALKGISRAVVRRRAEGWLRRFELADYANKRVDALSKGMAQKLQIISCVLHEPELIVLDEPFSGLDPVNVRLVRELVRELRQAGKLVILSTHMMSEVEAVCDRIVLINRGRRLLYGEVMKVRKEHTDYQVVVDRQAEPEGLACVERVETTASEKRVYLHVGATPMELMQQLGQARRAVERFETAAKPLEEIFVALVGQHVAPPTQPPPRGQVTP